MSIALDTRPHTATLTNVAWLQRLVPELAALSLEAKQAHWNVVGPGFLPLHKLTDELAADAREWTDRIAERALALGFPVDARPTTVASAAGDFPAGHIADRDAISQLTLTVDRAARTVGSSLADGELTDAVAQGIAAEIVEGLGKYRWMLQASTA